MLEKTRGAIWAATTVALVACTVRPKPTTPDDAVDVAVSEVATTETESVADARGDVPSHAPAPQLPLRANRSWGT
jgi:hypothetical protein